MKVLFLLKKNYNYGSYSTCKSGLFNSCTLLAQELMNQMEEVETVVETCVDGNELDKFLHKHRPKLCIIEAIWVTPSKMAEIEKLYPDITFIIRIHSKIPFLAMEGMVLTWAKEYVKLPRTFLAFNNIDTHKEMVLCGIDNLYLPNLYPIDNRLPPLIPMDNDVINIGCFGAIRPLKNQLLQAVASMAYANHAKRTLNFHMNSGRLEQKGDEVLKNIRALFSNTKHKLIEHPWMNREGFLDLVSKMDLGLQVSMSESFNIVTADFVKQGIPIIVSEDVSWMPTVTKVADNSSRDIMEKIIYAVSYRSMLTTVSSLYLKDYNKAALAEWQDLLL